MTLEAKINLLLRMQICQMDVFGASCQTCPYAKDWRSNTPVCKTALLNDAIKALEEGGTGAPSVEDMVNEILIDLGLTRKCRGYAMLVEAITYAIGHPEAEKRITEDLFGHVGEVFGCSSRVAAKAIGVAIESGISRCDVDTIDRYFGNTIHPDKGRPTNKEFVLRIVDIVKRDLRNEA